jgi:ATP-binding cassette subfamily B (MDR/TAP) protein 1
MMEPTMSALSKARAAVWRILQVVDRTVPIDSMSEKGSTLPNVQGTIKFDNVHFAYPSRPDQKVCQGYNLVVESGTTVALVGASGSGKSTAVSLVERFYDPDSGSVTLDGTDLKELNVRWLREQIGLVGQEPVLFSGTIADNISSGKPGSTREQVETAAKMANAHAFIMEFPEGYDTNVGEKGGQLSGGQKQRVAIARAMIKNPKVLLLDEATSALDNESEKVVQAALDDLMNEHKRTTIVIAHRLTTIRNADKIAVVDKGRIVEEGNHDQLMAKGPDGFYFKLNSSLPSSSSTDSLGRTALAAYAAVHMQGQHN